MASLFMQHLFWYDPVTYVVSHEACGDSTLLHQRIDQLTRVHNSTINCWNLQTGNGWRTSAMNHGSRPGRSNLFNVIDDNVPAEIKTLCLILNINWRT